jgi:serpin B
MTSLELLAYIGQAEDSYIMAARKRPKKKPTWPIVLAAVLALAVVGGGIGGYLRYSGQAVGSSTASPSSDLSTEAVMSMPSDQENEAEPYTMDPEEDAVIAASSTAYDVTLLASAQYPESIAHDAYDAQRQVWTENQVTEATSYALNAFSYRTAAAILQGQTESGCYSPLSLYQTLSILASGAQGQTQEELLSLLGMSDLDTLAEESGKLYRVNYVDDEVNRLKIANSLWLDETASDGTTIAYNQDWVLSTAANYYADVYEAEFSNVETAQALGAWIAENTGGFLSPTPQALNVDDSTVMAVANTVWYKTQWGDQFYESNTTSGDFALSSGDTVTADFMHRTDASGRYVSGDGYTKSYLQLNQGRMILVLPDEGTDIDSLLTEDKLWEIFENGDYQNAEVQWSIPKFETSATYADLANTLQALGVTSAFSLGADFSSISDSPLYVGSIQQGTHISVNEDGVEAASYSLADMMCGETEPEQLPVVEMNLNRPFIYLITANDGSTLFIGVVRNPNE